MRSRTYLDCSRDGNGRRRNTIGTGKVFESFSTDRRCSVFAVCSYHNSSRQSRKQRFSTHRHASAMMGGGASGAFEPPRIRRGLYARDSYATPCKPIRRGVAFPPPDPFSTPCYYRRTRDITNYYPFCYAAYDDVLMVFTCTRARRQTAGTLHTTTLMDDVAWAKSR